MEKKDKGKKITKPFLNTEGKLKEHFESNVPIVSVRLQDSMVNKLLQWRYNLCIQY